MLSLTALLAATGCAQQTPATGAASPPLQTNVTPAQELGAALHNRIQVMFGPGSDRLDPDANKQLDIAARLFRDVRPVTMFSIGYSDANGDEFGNLVLAARRARTVKMAMIARGIPANQVLMRSFGQSDPIDHAHPDAPENRRVLVTWDIM